MSTGYDPTRLRFEYGDEVIVKRNGTVIGEGRVQEEIGTRGRTAAVVKFEPGKWADVAATDRAAPPPLGKEDALRLIELLAEHRPSWAQGVIFKLVQHLFLSP